MITVRRTSRICICGDSISNWPTPGGSDAWRGLMDWISLFYRGGSAGYGGRSVFSSVPSTGPTFINASVNGDDVQLLDTRFNADVVALSPQPDIILIATAVNSTFLVGSQFTTSYNSILSKAAGMASAPQIACATIFCVQDAAPNTNDATIAAQNARIVTAAGIVGATVVDTRTPFLAFESATNPGHLSPGALTIDGIHPSPVGCTLMSNAAKAYFNRVGP